MDKILKKVHYSLGNRQTLITGDPPLLTPNVPIFIMKKIGIWTWPHPPFWANVSNFTVFFLTSSLRWWFINIIPTYSQLCQKWIQDSISETIKWTVFQMVGNIEGFTTTFRNESNNFGIARLFFEQHFYKVQLNISHISHFPRMKYWWKIFDVSKELRCPLEGPISGCSMSHILSQSHAHIGGYLSL